MIGRQSVLLAQPLSLFLVLGTGCWSSADYPDSDGQGNTGSGGTGSNASSTGAAGDTGDMTVPYDPEGPLGWASVPGMDLDGTVGGEGSEEITVETNVDFISQAGSFEAVIIRVKGALSGNVAVQSDKTIIGEPGASLSGTLSFNGVHNVIVKNLTIRGRNCADTSDACNTGEDAITVKGSHHLWFDHLDVSDGSDGNLDITEGSDYVTVSNSKFWYSDTTRNHRFSNLVGAADNNPIDEDKLRVTFFRNWWADNVEQRMPRVRYGLVHVLNNLYTSSTSDYCIAAGFRSTVLVENNVFAEVQNPHQVSSGDLWQSTTLTRPSRAIESRPATVSRLPTSTRWNPPNPLLKAS